jgi:hypothetical protein
MDKKGFLFTVTVFLVLTYILLSISVWVKGVETSERTFSEFYKESTVELAIEQITPAKMDSITNIIMQRSLHRLNEHTIDYPVKDEASIDEAMFELLMTGSASQSHFIGAKNISAEESSSLSTWARNLNASLKAIGVHISKFDVNHFQISQDAKDSVNYSFTIDLQMRDFSNTTAVTRNYSISNNISITGLVDPALARGSKEFTADDDLTVYRMFFFHEDYPDAASMVSQEATGTAGQGWLYRPLALANGTYIRNWMNTPIDQRHRFILVGTYDEIMAANYEDFGGYILTSAPNTSLTSCGTIETDTFNAIRYSDAPECAPYKGAPTMGLPYMVAPTFNAALAHECPALGNSTETERCVLMVSEYSESEVSSDVTLKLAGGALYGVEDLRDLVMCGYYTHNPDAPSYLQRLVNGSYLLNDSEYGIETFVIGNYANDYDLFEGMSRLDRELFDDSVSAIKIRGMPGCKDFSACSDEPVTGIFAVSEEVRDDYGLKDIACDKAAGCEE